MDYSFGFHQIFVATSRKKLEYKSVLKYLAEAGCFDYICRQGKTYNSLSAQKRTSEYSALNSRASVKCIECFYVDDEPEGKFLYTETIKLYCIVCFKEEQRSSWE